MRRLAAIALLFLSAPSLAFVGSSVQSIVKTGQILYGSEQKVITSTSAVTIDTTTGKVTLKDIQINGVCTGPGCGGGGAGTWGSINGTLSAQTDLQAYLTSLGVSSGSLRTSLNTVGTDTTTIAGNLSTEITNRTNANTGLTSRLNNLDTSTNTLTTRLNSVGVSTTAIALDTGAIKALDLTRTTFSSFTATQPILYNSATGAFSSTPISLSTSVVGILPIANGGTGTASPAISAGTNITSVTGTWPNVTINAATQGGSSGQLIYPSTGTPSFPYGVGATTGVFTSTVSALSFQTTGGGDWNSFTPTSDGKTYRIAGSSNPLTVGQMVVVQSTNGALGSQAIPTSGGQFIVSLTTGVMNVLPVASGGTGTASPAITAGTNITSVTGTWPNVTINAANQTASVSGGTAGYSSCWITASTLGHCVSAVASDGTCTCHGADPGPTSPIVSTVYVSTITASWTQVASDLGYILTASTASNFTGTLFSTTTTSGSVQSLVVDNGATLAPNTTYYLHVGSRWNDGTTTYVNTTPASTSTLAAVPGVPTFSNVYQTSMTVTWAVNSNPNYTPFEVSTNTVSSAFSGAVSTPIALTSNFTSNTTTFVGLAAGTTYYLRVRAQNSNGIITGFSTVASTKTAGGGGGGNSDTFTGTDGTALATYNANWVSMDTTNDVANLTIQGNTAEETGCGGWCSGGAMYNTSSSDISQAVYKAFSDASAVKQVCVRSGVDSGSNKSGYCAKFQIISAPNWTQVEVDKGGAYLNTYTGTWPTANDHTVKITASGTSPVTIHVWVDGSDLGTTTDSTSPYGPGKPGIASGANGTPSNSAIDAWQDY